MFISLVLYPAAGLLFRLFSQDAAVISQGIQMMHFLVPAYITYICIEILSGALRGCGDVAGPHADHGVRASAGCASCGCWQWCRRCTRC